MSGSWWLTVLALAVGVAMGCGPASDRLAGGPGVVRDSAGVEIVTGGGTDRALDWRFSTLWSVGLDFADPVLFATLEAHAVAVGAGGRVLALDGARRRVLVFDAAGAQVATLGSEGDLISPAALDVAPDGTVGVWDPARGGVQRWSAAGAPLPAVTVGEALAGPTIALLDAGAIAFVVRRGAGGAEGARDALVVYTEAGPAAVLARLATPARGTADFQSCGRTDGAAGPFLGQRLVWDAAGPVIALSDRAAYAIDVLRGGVRVRSVRRAIEPAAGSDALALREAGDGARAGGGEPCTIPPEEQARGREPPAAGVPIVLAVLLAPDGHLWVLRRADAGTVRIDVFDSEGGYLGTLPPASPYPVGFLADDRVVAIERTDDGVPYLAAYEVIR